MKKVFLLLIIFLILGQPILAIDLSDFSNEIKKYGNDYFPELYNDNLLESVTNMDKTMNVNNIISKLLRSITGEFRNNISIIFKIIGISILCVVLKNIQSNFSESGISEVAFYACYLLIVILVMSSFTNIIEMCKHTIGTLSEFMEFLIPIVISLLAVTGKITTIAVLQPILLAMISMITVLLTNVIIPIIFISTVISIISNISDRVNVKKLSELFKKCALWCMEISLVIFAAVLSLEGTLASNVDSVSTKATKTVVSNMIPVVGKLLGDTVDSVIGGINLTKNAVGTIGILVVISITIIPLVRVLILMLSFNLASAVIEPVADGRLVKCMSGIADSIKIVFAIMATTTFLFIIAISLMIKVTNV